MSVFKLKSSLPRETQNLINEYQAIPAGQRNADQAAFLANLDPYLHNQIDELDASGLISSASGNTVPTGDSGFKKGAIFIKKDAVDDGRYVNTGSETAAVWSDQAPDGSGLIPASQMRPYTVRGQAVKNTLYNKWDIVAYRGKRILITTAVTSSNVDNTFIGGANYIDLGPSAEYYAYDAGVVADGVTDDTLKLQAIIDQCSAYGGGTVILPAGYIAVSATIVLKANVWLKGQGRFGSVIKLLPNSNCDVIKNFVSTGSGVANAMFVGLFNVAIDGNKDNQNGAGPYHGIVFNTNPLTSAQVGDPYFDPHYICDNVFIYKPKGDGMHMTGRSAASIINTVAQFPDGYGFYSTFDTTYIDCESDGAGKSGWYISNSSVRLSGCKSFNSGLVDLLGSGYEIVSAGGVGLTACEAQNNKGRGLYIHGSKGVTAVGFVADGNNMADNDYAGIMIDASSNCVINGVCWQSTQGGVQVGHQDHALRVINSSTANSINISHYAASGASVGTAITSDSVLTGNNVIVNGVLQTLTGGTFCSGMLGDGSNGAADLDGVNTVPWATLSGGNTYTMSRNCYCTNITLRAGITLKPGGWIIFATGVITIEATAVLGEAGGAGNADGTVGTVGATGGVLSRGTAGGAGNTGAGSAANNTTSATIGVGNGGAGGLGSSGAGAAAQNANSTSTLYIKQPQPFLVGSINYLASIKPMGGAPGGGGGGGDGTVKGGGGGQGGPLVVIFAGSLINHGQLLAKGGAGGSPASGNAGGGGGGGGGLIATFTLVAITNDGTTDVTGGTGGTKQGTGVNGGNGGAGNVMNIVLQ